MATYTGADKRLAYLFGRTKDMTGATSEIDGAQGIIPKPKAGDNLKFLRGDGEWAEAGGNVHERELTQEEYDALTEEEKMNGTTYYITDGENPPDEMALGNLKDVAINSPTDGQILKYDAENAEWVNGDEPDISGLESRMTAAEGNIASIQNQLVISKSVSGSTVNFTDGANAPLLFCQADIVATQSGSGDPSPTNPRPISGFTGCTITANGNTYPISWQTEAGTVYGGYIDFRTGTLTVTWAEVDMGALTWTVMSSNTKMYRASPTGRYFGGDAQCRSEIYDFYGSNTSSGLVNNLENNQFGGYLTSRIIVVRDDRFTNDAAAFTAAVTGYKLIYELATPIEYYDLTKHQIWTSYTNNNISADTGDVYVDYITEQWQAIIDVVEEIIRGTS